MSENYATRSIATALAIICLVIVAVIYFTMGFVLALFAFFIPGPVALGWHILTERPAWSVAAVASSIMLVLGGMYSLVAIFAVKATRCWNLQ